jgi:hypothetical protein
VLVEWLKLESSRTATSTSCGSGRELNGAQQTAPATARQQEEGTVSCLLRAHPTTAGRDGSGLLCIGQLRLLVRLLLLLFVFFDVVEDEMCARAVEFDLLACKLFANGTRYARNAARHDQLQCQQHVLHRHSNHTGLARTEEPKRVGEGKARPRGRGVAYFEDKNGQNLIGVGDVWEPVVDLTSTATARHGTARHGATHTTSG